jgi:hypothetical protein
MSTTETENGTGALEAYVPFTPFEESYAFEAQPSMLEQPETAQLFTPFVSEYEGLQAPISAEAQELRELLYELYDQELDETLGQIAEEAWHAASERAEMFGETIGSPSAEQFLEEWISPLRTQAETLIDSVSEAFANLDTASLTENQVDEIFERFEPHGTGLESYFEDFLGGLVNKLKGFAKKAIDVAKKGLSFLPLGFLLKKVHGIIPALMRRVLRIALDRLPESVRPYARQLAQRILPQGEEGEDLVGATSAPDPSEIQQEFDLQLASLLFAPESEQEEIVAEAQYAAEQEAEGATLETLHEARARFVDEIEKGVAPQEALENFLPAVMAVMPIVRMVVKVLGRDKLVRALASPLASFVGRYVPPAAAGQLSNAIVDTGLRLLSLEAPTTTEVQQLAPQAIASAVEDTVARLGELDEATLEHPALLEAAITEAFHEAAAENFPPQLLIPELHEATVGGTWVAMPLGRKRKYYKKYTKVFDVEITPQIADALKIAGFLKDHMRVTTPVQARVHLYQATFGTTYHRVARLEQGVGGLGKGMRHARRLFHPLTTAAAGTLLREPKLGRDMPPGAGRRRHRIPVGKRFYYLEIAGARPVQPTGTTTAARAAAGRSSEVNVTLDFTKDEFRVFAYLSEADAQDIATKLRNRDVTAAIIAGKKLYEAGLSTALSGDIARHVKILSEELPQEQLFGGLLGRLTDQIKGLLAKKVSQWIGKAWSDYVQSRSAEFITATEDPADGVTLVVTIVNPPGAPLVRKLLKGSIGVGDVVGGIESVFKGDPKVGLQTVAGFRFD